MRPDDAERDHRGTDQRHEQGPAAFEQRWPWALPGMLDDQRSIKADHRGHCEAQDHEQSRKHRTLPTPDHAGLTRQPKVMRAKGDAEQTCVDQDKKGRIYELRDSSSVMPRVGCGPSVLGRRPVRATVKGPHHSQNGFQRSPRCVPMMLMRVQVFASGSPCRSTFAPLAKRHIIRSPSR